MATAHPLQWPAGWQRSASAKSSRFKVTHSAALRGLLNELRMMDANSIVISSNLEVKPDGTPYAARRHPVDPGVAVYFVSNGRQACIPCDTWACVEDNIHAIALTVRALRGIERWGSGKMVDAAFSGFKALPAPKSWQEILGVDSSCSADEAKDAFRRLAKENHPDRGGDIHGMQEINDAYARFQKERGI